VAEDKKIHYKRLIRKNYNRYTAGEIVLVRDEIGCLSPWSVVTTRSLVAEHLAHGWLIGFNL
jgi:hypothetical protein